MEKQLLARLEAYVEEHYRKARPVAPRWARMRTDTTLPKEKPAAARTRISKREGPSKEEGSSARAQMCASETPPREKPHNENMRAPWLRLAKTIDLLPVEETFATRLRRLIAEKGKKNAEVYKKAHIDRRLFSKIKTDETYMPSKPTVLALAIALELDEAEAKDLLGRAGYYLSRSQKGDVVVQFFIAHKIYDLFAVNEALAYYGLRVLGG